MTAPAQPASGAAEDWLAALRFDDQGLIPAIAQDAKTGTVLMMAWMNADAVRETVRTGRAVYYSRSRARLWRKGEESGHVQQVHDIRLDCDGDVLLLKITQIGGIACHTGRERCFYRSLDLDGDAPAWTVQDPVLKDPGTIYGHSHAHPHPGGH
ncbi:phosphoribosyl-AMP cyclohydrolase [Castellaniella defragrans]|jgi:phosphoribosyl-AMP cyclohydrolase|uniref:phosphoribosyl-AMP cyclohydrolase n=1 Tax=Castellaniella defragrans TaxID=75697 RepID=UPI0023F1965B|nr:phosphoribosyl-AMP cyclohydrolase [Castellaniella defragrans]